ncbi:MAG: alanine--glyoxylate aminotransferase family protein, partial [Actinomycetia bacterium]|nr:alanine--glyoxylate aminotransferase family protein [Actinomycetes bacterium]
LNEALDLIDEEGGIEVVWQRHEHLADAVRAAVEAWSTPGGISLNIQSAEHRSNAVTTVLTGDIDATELRRRCEEQAGLVLGIGMMVAPDRSFRIGHMGWLNPPMILGTLATIEATLVAMGAPMGGSGISAAAEVIGHAFNV